MSREVVLVGGPADGVKVTVNGTGLNVQGHGVPDGFVAHYRPALDRTIYRYKGMSKILATMPDPARQ